jgi:hypothetical protein
MSKSRAVPAERRALLVVVSLFVGVVVGMVVAALLIAANAHPAYGILAGGAAFGAAVSLALRVFAALAWW